MRILSVNGSPDSRWKWFTIPNADGAAVELYCPTTDEFLRAGKRFRFTDKGEDMAGFKRYLAEHWFRDFRGMFDAKGEPLENTVEMRVAICNETDIWRWLQEQFLNAAQWRDEGNASSGTA